MKLLPLLSLVAVCLFAAPGASQKVKADDIKYDMDHLEKTYGVRFKSAKLQMGSGGATLITITLEFTKDLTGAERDKLSTLFSGKQSRSLVPTAFGQDLILLCYFFDEDSVAFTKQPPGKIEGEVSGKSGDAFRITQTVPSDVRAKTKRISFREEKGKPKK